MRKVCMFFLLLLAGILFSGLGQEELKAAENGAPTAGQIIINEDKENVTIPAGETGIIKKKKGNPNSVTINGTLTLKENAELNVKSNVTIKGALILEKGAVLNVNSDVTMNVKDEEETGNTEDGNNSEDEAVNGKMGEGTQEDGQKSEVKVVSIANGAQINIISGTFSVELSETEPTESQQNFLQKKAPDIQKVFENLGTVRINRKKAALLIDSSYEISTSNETQDDGADPAGTTDDQNKTEGIFLFSSCNDEDSEQPEWSDILECPYGMQPGAKFEEEIKNEQIYMPDLYDFAAVDIADWNVPTEEKYQEYRFTYKELAGENTSDDGTASNYAKVWFTVKVLVVPADISGGEENGGDTEQENPGKPKPSIPSAPVTDLSKPTPGDPTVETPKPSVPAPSTPVQETPSTASEGKCGDNVTYRYKDGVLTISGKGAMTDLSCQNTKTLEEDASAGRKSNYGGMDAYAEKTKKIVIESGVTRIGRGAFAYFKNLESVEIKGGKKAKLSVGQYAFAGCGKLKKVSMKNVKEINFFAFGNCKSLKKLTLRKGVTSIGKSAFYGCKKLKSINLPSTVKEMGDYCFYGCKKLKTVKVNGNIKKAGKYMFYSAGKKAVIRCASKKANNCKFVKKANAEGIKIKRK